VIKYLYTGDPYKSKSMAVHLPSWIQTTKQVNNNFLPWLKLTNSFIRSEPVPASTFRVSWYMMTSTDHLAKQTSNMMSEATAACCSVKLGKQ